ncbi:docking domain of Afi1 for Arf3 in vesicle trafficking-domain-containing protein [Irpex rosettiformis]|uniref:Docking domain of Afi1 for Arf3 in vesicle trafficking-domain-containing protein n=1 Tax=Irpex rosettiformis TaxID=378272 RepID=A0ACB8U7W5_9APHY|nr:docking domain of Afi1 for Arf3 in vesicle trafficking-domain-containing protein [Irpex rosettiformis]
MTGGAEHCSFVLLADFDIDRGAQLTYQFPQPLGTDETLLANLMLPDGAERQPEDWTIFFLNQRPFNTIAPVLALEPSESHGGEADGRNEDKSQELIYVLNLVRTKLDKTVRRGAIVKAMAICTRHSFIEIFKPVLLMALDDYFMNPSQDCLARLFDAVNSMDISMAPVLSRFERLIMRTSERKDVFLEKFEELSRPAGSEPPVHNPTHKTEGSVGSQSSFEEGILMRGQPKGRDRDSVKNATASATSLPSTNQHSPSDGSFSLDGSAVWVENGHDQSMSQAGTNASSTAVGTNRSTSLRGRKSMDASSSASSHNHGRRDEAGAIPALTTTNPPLLKDTHFFPATIEYNDHQLPIRLPMCTFQEEVGDYSLIQLVQTFSAPSTTITGPIHPHLHTSGNQTHPIIILFNALVTGKRIIFLGHHRPAGQVSSYVLSACALGSGCGIVPRGLIKRAFPYANLINKEEWESTPAYIAGVTNPIFEASASWDLLCDIGTSRMVISKDIHQNHPAGMPANPVQLIVRSGTVKAEGSLGSEEEMSRPSKDLNPVQKAEFVGKVETADNIFMEDIISAISLHYGEAHVRARFTEYATRFVRLAARFEEDVLGINTTIGYPGVSYIESSGEEPRLGSGLCFTDEAAGVRELAANASRIEAWRRTESYELWQQDFNKLKNTNPIQGVDIAHQLWKLRHSKRMSEGEASLIYRTLAENTQTYDQVTELLSLLPPHHNGLLPLSFGLFHQQEMVREYTVEIFNELRSYSVGVQFLQALNHFQRYAYVRQAHVRESRLARDHNTLTIPPSYMSRTPSNRSESSLAGG